jgi:hypothetical protein
MRFVENARRDVPSLRAEVRRLEAALEIARRDAMTRSLVPWANGPNAANRPIS